MGDHGGREQQRGETMCAVRGSGWGASLWRVDAPPVASSLDGEHGGGVHGPVVEIGGRVVEEEGGEGEHALQTRGAHVSARSERGEEGESQLPHEEPAATRESVGARAWCSLSPL